MTNKKDDKTVEMFPTSMDDIREGDKHQPEPHTQMDAHGTGTREDSKQPPDAHVQKPSRSDWQRLYQAADAALYAVKRGGKDAIAFHSTPQDAARDQLGEDILANEGDELCDIDGMCAEDDEQE